jgi:hypothetical protein
MKTLKEMKAAMTASEMKHFVGGAEVAAIDPDLIDDDPANRIKSVSSDCPNGRVLNCRTLVGALRWVCDVVMDPRVPAPFW